MIFLYSLLWLFSLLKKDLTCLLCMVCYITHNACFNLESECFCLDIMKTAKLLSHEMSRAHINNCFFRIRLYSSNLKVIIVGYTW